MNDVEKAIEFYKAKSYEEGGIRDRYTRLAIEALERQLNGGWTNAIEKPSKSDDYLVYYHKKYDSCNFETNLHGICSFIDIYGGWQTEEGETILAWQSLPEPYKED